MGSPLDADIKLSEVRKPTLWTHPDPDSTRMAGFMHRINQRYNLRLNNYDELYQWSIESIGPFWTEVWDFCGISATKKFDKVIQDDPKLFPRPDFFAGSHLNFAGNLLFPANVSLDSSSVAIIEATEVGNTNVSWDELRERVRQCANAFRSHGIKELDRVAGFLGNHSNAVVAMLAAASIGAIWTGVSPDTARGRGVEIGAVQGMLEWRSWRVQWSSVECIAIFAHHRVLVPVTGNTKPIFSVVLRLFPAKIHFRLPRRVCTEYIFSIDLQAAIMSFKQIATIYFVFCSL